ncbi:hemerythrin HHE cation binding domain protein [Clostridium homopropionicum DSM 5847]|uniref:Hemerythrin HHE cation binding domain protein n=1 Tax=Clostridium homopropionicum DSM 5847 TaxID=1121318 RepID=A0A0L6Z9Q1_9CLOT|nr:hemerythrin domain-containing protein [Clostridium homopropionicum]KOA19692.1 hemerythrin HHE cation binding domain protein [Clostridium homopropionicum DSM 5847]SFF79895.1 Hemerythrin-like domain-containing protein [Clostridium homopropionicum]
MNAINIMMEEHKNILRMLEVIRKVCIKVVNNEQVDYNNFYKIIDFVRNYADKHHHSKEEIVLFEKLKGGDNNRIGKVTVEGMLVEHDLGRLFMMNLEEALKKYEAGDMDSRVDIIANSIGYSDLLKRHIFKEDNALYKYAKNNLSKEDLDEIDEKCKEIEEKAGERKVQEKYMKLLDELESGIVF